MRLNHLIVTSLLLFSFSSILYGALTGASFMLKDALVGSAAFGVAVFVLLIFCAYGIAKYVMDQTYGYKVWLLSGFISFLPIVFLVFVFDAKNNWGQIFRFYVSTIAFYVLPVFCIYEACFKKSSLFRQPVKPGVLMAVAIFSFLLGLVIYLAKSGLALQGNHNFAMQYLLSLLCLSLPLCVGIAAVRTRIISMKSQES